MKLDKYNNPIITGDTDTDELLEDERISQQDYAKEYNELVASELEDKAIDQLINHKRGK